MVDMSDQEGRLFSMTMLPDDAVWLQSEAEPVLAWKKEPVQIRVIGNLVGVDYKASRTRNAIMNIEVELLRLKDMRALQALKSDAMREPGKQPIVREEINAYLLQPHRQKPSFSSASCLGNFR